MLEGYLRPLGIECERIAKDPERPNLLVRLPGRGIGPSLAVLAKRAADERVLIDDLVFQVAAATSIARSIGSTTTNVSRAAQQHASSRA